MLVNWFTDRHFFLLAVALYSVSAMYSVFLWRKGFRKDDHANYFLLLAAFALHTAAMVKRGFSMAHCPVNNLYEATTFVAWTIVAAYLVIGLLPRLRFLARFAAPGLAGHRRFPPKPGAGPAASGGSAAGIFRRAGQSACRDHFAGLRRVRLGRGRGGHVPDATA